MSATTIVKADLVLPDRIVTDGYLTCTDGVIAAIGTTPPVLPGTPVTDYSGHYLIPGLIDLQVNGGGGTLFNDAQSIADLHAIIDDHRTHGTTGFLATLMCDEPAHLVRQLGLMADALAHDAHVQNHILGIHLEGPFFNPQKRGMHAAHLVMPPDASWMQRWIDAARGQLKIVTLAPELPGALDVVRLLRSQAITVSMAHSLAHYDEALQAIAAGAAMGTHLFNTMPPMAGREPGLAGALLDSDSVSAGIINDGVHLHDATVRLALHAKGIDKIFFVSDAMHDVGGRDTILAYRGMTLHARGGVCYNDAGALAGSAAPLLSGLRRAVSHLGINLVDAVRLCATQPADLIGRPDRGRLAVGAAADFVMCDRAVRIV